MNKIGKFDSPSRISQVSISKDVYEAIVTRNGIVTKSDLTVRRGRLQQYKTNENQNTASYLQ